MRSEATLSCQTERRKRRERPHALLSVPRGAPLSESPFSRRAIDESADGSPEAHTPKMAAWRGLEPDPGLKTRPQARERPVTERRLGLRSHDAAARRRRHKRTDAELHCRRTAVGDRRTQKRKKGPLPRDPKEAGLYALLFA